MLFALLLAGGAYLAWDSAVILEPPQTTMRLSWLTLAALFAIAESLVAHISFRRETFRYTMAEVPLVLGLVFATPTELLIGHLVGVAVAHAIRRHRLTSLSFSLSRVALDTVLAIAAFQQLGDVSDPLAPAVWAAVFAAAAVSASTDLVATTAAVAVAEREVQVARFWRTTALAFIVTGTNTSLALAAAIVLDVRPMSGFLLTVPIVSLVLGYQAYVNERKRHKSVEFLYTTAQTINRRVGFEETVDAILGEITVMQRAEVAELVLFSPKGPVRRAVVKNGESLRLHEVADHVCDLLRRATSGAASSTLVSPSDSTSRYRPYLDERGIRDSIVAPLLGERRILGLLIVGNRSTGFAGFGADDLKLVTTVARHLSVSLENEQLEQTLRKLTELERRLTHQAFHDSLTGLVNRTRFVEDVGRRLGRGAATVMFIDLDDFKTVNDTLGHATGDEVLRAVARRLTNAVRPDDLVARLGGDEFAILLASRATNPEGIAERLISAFDRPLWFGGRERTIRASIGISAAERGGDVDDVLRKADLAMYAAKSNGKGTYATFTPDMHESVVRRHDLQHDLVRAVERREFEVHYQPIMRLGDGRPTMVEALSRWHSPNRGCVPPDQFIPIAEESDLVVQIDRLVMEEAFTQLASWKRELGPCAPRHVAVNLSTRHFLHDSAVSEVKAALDAAALCPGDLVLEITETVMMEDIEANVAKLNALRDLGVRIALDDFGTGYSSLSYLRRLPLDIIKVARPFVHAMDERPGDEIFVRAIVDLAHTLDMEVVAEGVETPSQLRRLVALGCDYVQGYLIQRPEPVATTADYLVQAGSTRPLTLPVGLPVKTG